MSTEEMCAAVPADFEVQPIDPDDPTAEDPCTCGTCGLTWDDGISTSWTPVPSGRCPFEYFHTAIRLEYLRSQLDAERISYGELIELQNLADDIDPSDVQLLEAAGVPEHEEEGGITLEGQALGHRYVMGNVNAYCPQCSANAEAEEGRLVTVLDCDYDIDK